ncbi:MAG TPA: hypothetical protein VK920_07290 [Solirubrobacterales bacterium]|nr:hypothetical protein [Solirubrobacterales bacterium]
MTAPNRGRKRRRRPRSGDRVAPLMQRARRSASERRRRAAPAAVEARARALALARRGALVEIGRAIAAAADAGGRLELRIAALLGRPTRAAARRGAALLRAAERAVTPPRAVAAVILCAAVVLGISQFVDYRGVRIGAQLYEGVEAVAPAPQTAREPAGSAHAYVLLPAAALAVVAGGLALRGRWQLGRAVSLLGLIGVAVSLLVDRPTGLEEGIAARNFEGAEAVLIEGFWVQLAASTVLVVAGALLTRYARAKARDLRADRAGKQAHGLQADRAVRGKIGARGRRPASGGLA